MPPMSLRTITTAVVVVLVSCKGKDAAPPAAAENLLRVTTADFAFQAPDQVPAGVTTIRLVNQGPSFHHLQLIKLNEGKTLPDLLEAMKAPGPLPAWAVMMGGPNAAGVGDSITLVETLEPGSYAMICLIPGTDGVPHFAKGMTRLLTVTPPAGAPAEPAADNTVTLKDYAFEFSQPLTGGHHTIRVNNEGQQAHELVLVKLDAGKTASDFLDWASKMAGTPPGSPQGGVTGLMPGAHGFLVTDLAPGNYALVCFFPDAKDGKPHFAHGMVTTVTVS
jgi:uncharacterized cupredoxin-like copper-binding protein